MTLTRPTAIITVLKRGAAPPLGLVISSLVKVEGHVTDKGVGLRIKKGVTNTGRPCKVSSSGRTLSPMAILGRSNCVGLMGRVNSAGLITAGRRVVQKGRAFS